MDKKKNYFPQSDWVPSKLTKLQQELETSGKWPEPANQLWLDLARSQQADDKKADDIMFSIVVSDAIDGVDIAKKHPEFYRRMLKNPELFRSFLDVVEVMEADRAGLLEPVETIETAVPVVMPDDPRPKIERLVSGGWLVRWRQGVAQLNALFDSIGPNLALSPGMRGNQGWLEESVAPLIRSEVVVEERNFGVRLSAVLADDPDALDLQLTVALLDEEMIEFPITSLRADVQWGSYRQEQALNELGQATFPALPIQAIFDEKGKAINNDLQLLIQSDT